ncbi:hypothetical protein [Guptibacillus algicola]|uniref:hypothetical protein n=1 Tax=Guptibacillus algicola TaxID=225844 RepID=UPI001CD514E2|nr:hypothetical protein [Alkalihalobacillus algicola]MCA0988474.1 hypothetical protein [Alkalihalobacillus algicola]
MYRFLSALVVAGLVFMGMNTPAFAANHGEPPIKEMEQKFHELIHQETNEDGVVKNYDSKDRLEQEFNQHMLPEPARYYVDTYFKEEDGKLYLKSMDAPVEVMWDKDYTLEQIDDQNYKLTQTGENELRGEYTLTINYTYEADKWEFADRTVEKGATEDTGGEMPDTATNLPTMMLIGSGAVLAGAVVLVAKRRVEE